jgi:hypothetical protein
MKLNRIFKNQTLKKVLLVVCTVGISTAIVVLGQPEQQVNATLYNRQKETDVILPDWEGRWQCNLDGRQAILELKLTDSRECQGDTCTTTSGTKIAGRVRDQGTWKPVEQRSFNSNDPSSSRRDHMLPLRHNNSNNWLLMMHTWDRNYISGYTSWQGIPFGIQYEKS